MRFRTHMLIGLFVACFLIFFQPFQTDQWDNPVKRQVLCGYGLVSFIALTLVDSGLYFKGFQELEKRWTVWRELVYQVMVILLIALGNMLYSNQIGISRLSFIAYLTWTSVVLMVGFFPILGLILFKHAYFKALNQQTATKIEEAVGAMQMEIPSQEKTVTINLVAENERERLSIALDDLWYIESADNYVFVMHREGERLRKSVLRGSLRQFEQQLCTVQALVRCHRSYIVNLQKVETVAGNAQGYRLSLGEFGVEVPVARQYGPVVLAALRAPLAERP